jgi:CubicO group peptidase (beta-lactamase class C family)
MLPYPKIGGIYAFRQAYGDFDGHTLVRIDNHRGSTCSNGNHAKRFSDTSARPGLTFTNMRGKLMHRREFLKLLAYVSALGPFAGCSGSRREDTDYSGVVSAMRAEIAEQMNRNQVTGLAVCLVDGRRVVWTEGFGFADLRHGIKADEDTAFEIGSTSKTFTGFMVMQLAEKGLIGLDDPVTMYIPSFSLGAPFGGSGVSRPVTIRSMLTHHSGIPGDLFNGAFTTVFDPAFNDHLLEVINTDVASWPTDTVWSYSNTAISLLQKVIEASSGMSFADYSRGFLQSMGMTSSSFYLNDHPAGTRISRNYFLGTEVPTPQINIPPTGAIRASITDMSKYLRMVMAGGEAEGIRIVASQTLAAMLTRQNANVPLDFDLSIGITWFLSDTDLAYAGPLCWHNGATISSNSHMEILLENGLAAMCVSNSATGSGAVESIVKNTLKSALKVKKGIEPTYPVSVPSQPVAKPQAEIDALAGIYVNAKNWHKVISVSGGLDIIMGAQDYLSGSTAPTPIRVIPRANGYFSQADSQGTQLEFKPVSGRFVLALHSKGVASLFGERYSPLTVSATWTARLGKWAISNRSPIDISPLMPEELRLVGSQAELLMSDSMLVLSTNLGHYVLEPLSETLCKVRGLGRNNGNSVRIVTLNGSERMRFLDLEYAKI